MSGKRFEHGLILVILLTGLLGGCNETPPTTASRFQPDLDSALALTDIPKRDAALAAVVADAATAGEEGIVKKALAKISTIPERDRAASVATLRLAKGGKMEQAKEVAMLISVPQKRNEILYRLEHNILDE
jgi:hypothetical protein